MTRTRAGSASTRASPAATHRANTPRLQTHWAHVYTAWVYTAVHIRQRTRLTTACRKSAMSCARDGGTGGSSAGCARSLVLSSALESRIGTGRVICLRQLKFCRSGGSARLRLGLSPDTRHTGLRSPHGPRHERIHIQYWPLQRAICPPDRVAAITQHLQTIRHGENTHCMYARTYRYRNE